MKTAKLLLFLAIYLNFCENDQGRYLIRYYIFPWQRTKIPHKISQTFLLLHFFTYYYFFTNFLLIIIRSWMYQLHHELLNGLESYLGIE